jgi:DnaJ-class molecular chaperone
VTAPAEAQEESRSAEVRAAVAAPVEVDAYRTLSRPTARRMYDMFGHHGLGTDAVDELARWLGARRSTKLGDGRLLQIESCPECDGSGRLVRRPCEACAGEGRVRGRRVVEVEVSAGTADGEVMLVGEGALEVRVHSLPDAPLVRYATVALLVAALAFLGLLLLP